ncbi:hypothetical protein L362_00045 [Enterobacter sp. MGH 16]|nr:hypothetical protein L362_00045 [Enterobacter sp. MGH 16]
MNKGKLSVERFLREALQIKNSIFFVADGKSRYLWFLKVFSLLKHQHQHQKCGFSIF